MQINENLLRSIGATEQNYSPGDYIFRENDFSKNYFHILSGKVKLNNYDSDGKEFIQNIINSKDSVGTFMLFIEKGYPVNAMAITDCVILQVPKKIVFDLFKQSPDFLIDIRKGISERLNNKFILMQKISSHNAAERLKDVMELMKQEQKYETPFSFEIPFTRQQLASLTGLCVETTIRTIKKMEREKLLRIKNRKILI
jgi:CRP-like cAMP-binding protein